MNGNIERIPRSLLQGWRANPMDKILAEKIPCKLPQDTLRFPFITPAIKSVTDVIPAKAGIQKDTGCRIMSGMTGFGYLVAGLIATLQFSLAL